MSHELAVRSDPYPGVFPDVPADSWRLPVEAVEELTRALSTRANTKVVTESVGLTGFIGHAPKERRVTTRFGIITEVELGRLVMEVAFGVTRKNVEGIPGTETVVLPDSDKGSTVIPVYRETKLWGLLGEERQEASAAAEIFAFDNELVTNTEHIASVVVEGGRKIVFDPPPPHLHF